MIEVKNLSYSYTAAHSLLQNISFSIADGEVLAVAGRNGTGKTTITRLLMGLLQPAGGQILFDGEDVTAESVSKRSAVVGYVFQNPDRQIFANTVLEEVMFAPLQHDFTRENAEKQARKALEAVELLEFLQQSPQLLSRGQKQRLAIASALAAKPSLLILDEPTSGQDCRERVKLLRLMRRLNQKGMSILLVTHDMDILAEHASRVLVLENGGIGDYGKPLRLFADEGRTTELGLELPEAVRVSREMGLRLCLTPSEIYGQLEERKRLHA